jgi:hypothetical protein
MFFLWLVDGHLPGNVYVCSEPIEECREADYPDVALYGHWLCDKFLQVRLGDQLHLRVGAADDGLWPLLHHLPGHQLIPL